jgi:hypothetical protein
MKKYILLLIFGFSIIFIATAQEVQPFSVPAKIPPAWKDFSDRIYLSVEKQAHYFLGLVHEWEQDKSLKLLNDSIKKHEIRPIACTVAGFSFLYRFGNYDQNITGVSRKQLLEDYIIPIMRYMIRTHLTGDLNTDEGKKWGNAWQSVHWTCRLAKGAWWIWDSLPVDVQEGIRKVVRFELERFYNLEPPARLEHDTASEENAWNSQIFQVAILLMPNDKDVPLWKELLKKWVISSYIRPSDIKSDRIIDGIQLSSFKGANLYDDYTLENHRIVHPDYMGSFIQTAQLALDYVMRNKKVPDFVFFNTREIYENLKWFALPDGGLNYPSGQDWPIYGNPDWLFHHCILASFLHDPDAPELARRVLDCTEKMQKRNPEGNVYTKEENVSLTPHTDIFYYSALSWLTMYYMDEVPDHFIEKTDIKTFDSGKIIVNRTPNAIHSLSWGAKIMFQSVANQLDRIFDSDMRNGIGYVILKDHSKALPVTLGDDFQLKTGKKKFKAEFSVNHGNEITAYYRIKSCPDRLEVSEKLVANMDIETETIATSCFGVLNNKDWVYEKGQRTILTDKGQYNFLSGQENKKVFRSKNIRIDGSLLFHSGNYMNAIYESETAYKRCRITDHLVLNHLTGIRTWKKGEIISTVDYAIIID